MLCYAVLCAGISLTWSLAHADLVHPCGILHVNSAGADAIGANNLEDGGGGWRRDGGGGGHQREAERVVWVT